MARLPTKFTRSRTSLYLLLVQLACGEQDDTRVTPPPTEDPDSEVPGGGNGGGPSTPRPVYALLSVVFNPDESATSYVALTDSPDVDAISLDTAREFPGRVSIGTVGGELFVASEDEPRISRYSFNDQLEWQDEGALSFANLGLSPDSQAHFYSQSLVGEQAAYIELDVSGRVAWDPGGFQILGTHEQSRVTKQRGGLQAYAIGNGFQRLPGLPLRAFAYDDEEGYDRGSVTEIAMYDPVTHEETNVIEAPCPAIGVQSSDEAGNVYLANWDYWPTLALYGQAPKSCVLRMKPDGSVDPEWSSDLSAWTGGRQLMAFYYLRDGKAIGNVLHHELLGADFTGPYDPDVNDEIVNGQYYRPWLFDLETQTAQPISGIDEILWALNVSKFDDRSFALLPYDDYGRTEIYEIGVDGTAVRRLEVTGYVESWKRVR